MWPHEWNFRETWVSDLENLRLTLYIKSLARESYLWSRCRSIVVDRLFIFMHNVIIYQHWDSMKEGSVTDLPYSLRRNPHQWTLFPLVGLVSSTPLFSVKSSYISCDFSLCFSCDKS
jgi:hypothetical protein